MPKRILFLTWKDINHPASGGAELLTDALASHMAKTHEVTYFTSSYPGALRTERIHNYTVIRRGNLYTTYVHAFLWWHWNRTYTKKYSAIIDQVHGIPFFSLLWYKHPRVFTLVMEVAGELWSNVRFPLLGVFGKALERVWLALYKKHTVITISKSTKDDLIAQGITPNNIYIIPMFSNIHCEHIPQKSETPTLLVIGRIAPVKRIEDAIDAYRMARASIPSLKLVIIGKTEPAYEEYKSLLRKKIAGNTGIMLIENGTEEDKKTWLKQSHLLLMTSRKEGYGLVILEAASCGTPAIGYRVPGVQDAIINKQTGMLTDAETPEYLAHAIEELFNDTSTYRTMQEAVFQHSKQYTIAHTQEAFHRVVERMPL